MSPHPNSPEGLLMNSILGSLKHEIKTIHSKVCLCACLCKATLHSSNSNVRYFIRLNQIILSSGDQYKAIGTLLFI